MRERHPLIVLCLLAGAALLVASSGCGGSTSVPVSPTPSPLASLPTPPAPGPTPQGATVSIVAGASALTTTAYAPNPLNVAVGGTVVWVNNDVTAHTSTADNGTWNSGTIAPGRSFSRTFSSAGTFLYRCAIHPGMMGTITVQ
jgi:plastocyanin